MRVKVGASLKSFYGVEIEKILGENNEMLQRTLQLGISLLHGGNREVQKVN